MVDEVHTKYVDRPLCANIFHLHDIRTEGGALYCTYKLRSRLLVAAGGSLRFGCQHPPPRRSKQGTPFQDSHRQRENTRSKYTCKKDSKSSVYI